MTRTHSMLESLLNQQVVLDVTSLYVYLGKLTNIEEHFLVLEEADVHDLRDTNTTRERYVLEAREVGVRPNRDRVFVRMDEIVSVSALIDVIV